LIGQWLSERLGQQFFIENRPDASGNIAAEAVVRSPPDGYTLLVTNDANAYSATLYDNLKFNFIHDITPVASIWRVGFVMVVNPSFAAKTVPELMSDLSPKGDPKRTSLHHAQAPAVLDHLRTPPQGDGDAGPTLAGGAVGGERNMVVLDASDVLDDAFAVRSPCVDAEGEVSSRCAQLTACFYSSGEGRSGAPVRAPHEAVRARFRSRVCCARARTAPLALRVVAPLPSRRFRP
jgi:hypothetical protein